LVTGDYNSFKKFWQEGIKFSACGPLSNMKAVAEGRSPVSQKTLGQPQKTVNQKVDMKNDDLPSGALGWLKRHERGFLMNKNMKTFSKIGGLGLAGVLAFGASSAMAEEFTASADVQSTLTITIVNDLNFGTLFAATASSGEVDSLTLAPAGTFTTGPETSTVVNLLSLGGAVQPAQGSVATSNVFTLDLPDDIADVTAGSINNDAGVTEMTIDGGDPDVAKFLVGNFRVDELVGGTDTAGGAAPDVEIDPDFGSTEVSFNIGADVFTDDGAGVGGIREAYEDGTYSGTFTVTASF
jgi:hypothetical protein